MNIITWQVGNEELILQWREEGGRRWYIEIGREREEWCVEGVGGSVQVWEGVGEKGVCCGRQGRGESNVGKEIWERPGV